MLAIHSLEIIVTTMLFRSELGTFMTTLETTAYHISTLKDDVPGVLEQQEYEVRSLL